ncbi:MAG: hypothetical protein SGBAC_007469, partial [Bacillariaceae sp.]
EVIAKTATVYSELYPRKKDVANLQGTWKIEGDASQIIWDPQDILVYPQRFQELDTSVPHGVWGIPTNTTPNSDGTWDVNNNIWFLAPGKSRENFVCCGKWAYSPTKRNVTWPPPPSKEFPQVQKVASTRKDEKAPTEATKKKDSSSTSAPSKEDTTDTGLSSTKFFSRNSTASAALRKKREIERRFSNTSSKTSTSTTSDKPGDRSAVIMLKKRSLERRYSLTSHKETSEAIRKSREARKQRYSSNETLRLSKSASNILEASSALIASVLPTTFPPPTISETPSPVLVTRKESTIPKQELVDLLLAEHGSLVVLCTDSPDTRTMSLDQDNALLLCYDVPNYDIVYIETEPTLGQELLEVSRKSIYPQFFYESTADSDCEDEFGEDGADKKKEKAKHIYLGGMATVRVMLTERMSFQYRSKQQRIRKSSSRPSRVKSLDIYG